MKGTVFIPPIHGAHRWFVISDAVGGEVLTVNITDAENEDSTCILLEGEHVSVTKPSAVRYRSAKLWKVQDLQASLGQCHVFQQLCPPAILQRMVQGFLESEHFAEEYLKFLQ
ncbi:MAG TPA: hypothetical protein VGO11_17645 [Chthoniobacteraceae bacterium]|jgi:hypothetical protein|nr:hypothetical protein [Chthoniobacteraceae bacterium]